MADIRIPRPLPEHRLPPLNGWEPTGPFAVAVSAGADSTALLWACALRWPQWTRAIHVNHGLQQAASDFEWHARHLCSRLGIPCVVEHAQAHPAKGQSPEEAARIGRYQALAHAAKSQFDVPLKEVLLAQHADDQAESVMLAWSRGTGLAGLAAMPQSIEREGIRFVRPWLDASGAALRVALRQAGVPWVEDPSNGSDAYTRNRIRHEVLPVLEQALPGSKVTLVRTARHAAQSLRLLAELAEMDGLRAGVLPKIADLRLLPAHRLSNLLRHWLAEQGTQAQTAQLEELLRQVSACKTRGHRIHLRVGAGHVIRQGEVLAWLQSKV
jgi:tRNA(Ile)-lysidine synthase